MKRRFSGRGIEGVYRKIGGSLVDWWSARKRKKVILAGTLLGMIFLGTTIYQMCPGGNIWFALSAQDRISTYDLKKGEVCYLQRSQSATMLNSADCMAWPSFSREELFGADKRFILYGKIEKINSYVIKRDSLGNGRKANPLPCYCHVLTVRVRRGISGGVHWNQRVNLLCRWKYSSDEEYREGKEGVFIVGGKVTKLYDKEKEETLYILGEVGNRGANYLIKWEKEDENGLFLGKGLNRIHNKEDAISYYKKNGWLK